MKLNFWYEELIWCPSQCYYFFLDRGKLKCIYLRWRYSDPWTVDLITLPESEMNEDWPDINAKEAKWESIDLGYYSDDDLKKLQKKAVKKLVRHRFWNFLKLIK